MNSSFIKLHDFAKRLEKFPVDWSNGLQKKHAIVSTDGRLCQITETSFFNKEPFVAYSSSPEFLKHAIRKIGRHTIRQALLAGKKARSRLHKSTLNQIILDVRDAQNSTANYINITPIDWSNDNQLKYYISYCSEFGGIFQAETYDEYIPFVPYSTNIEFYKYVVDKVGMGDLLLSYFPEVKDYV